jgi:hypothetical protein
VSRRRGNGWGDKHLGRAIELIEEARDLAHDQGEHLRAAEIHSPTILLKALYESGTGRYQQNTGAKFVAESIADLEDVLAEDVSEDVAHRLRNAYQHLDALRYCPVCGREVATELVVESVGSGSRNVPRGSVCVTPAEAPDGWRLFCHEGGESA